jgi:hypothetical protein
MNEYNELQMIHLKKALSTKNIVLVIFFILICFFSCDKSSEKSDENVSATSQDNRPQSAAPTDSTPTNPSINDKPIPVPESIVPEQIRRPQLGEAPRIPEDSIIGPLGAGEAPAGSYRFTQVVLQNILNEESRMETGTNALSHLPAEQYKKIITILEDLNPEEVRIGGGQEELDASVSFLLRFIGADKWSGGEIFVRRSEDDWNLEDLILDAPRERNQENGSYRFDFPPYERFY